MSLYRSLYRLRLDLHHAVAPRLPYEGCCGRHLAQCPVLCRQGRGSLQVYAIALVMLLSTPVPTSIECSQNTCRTTPRYPHENPVFSISVYRWIECQANRDRFCCDRLLFDAEYMDYTVQSGDTLLRIASLYGTIPSNVVTHGGSHPNQYSLISGQILVVLPAYNVVVEGDTSLSLAKKHKRHHKGLPILSTLKAGQRIQA